MHAQICTKYCQNVHMKVRSAAAISTPAASKSKLNYLVIWIYQISHQNEGPKLLLIDSGCSVRVNDSTVFPLRQNNFWWPRICFITSNSQCLFFIKEKLKSYESQTHTVAPFQKLKLTITRRFVI